MPRPRQLPPADVDDQVDDQPAGETPAGEGLTVDPGPAFIPAGDRRREEPVDDGGVEVLPPETPGPVTTELATLGLRAVWGVAHHATRLTGGPDDAFRPSQAELREQAAPLAEIANRYPLLARAIHLSPYLAAAVEIGGYAGGELERVADYRRGGNVATSTPGVASSPAAPPPPASAVRTTAEPPQQTDYGVGMDRPPRPGPVPTVGQR